MILKIAILAIGAVLVLIVYGAILRAYLTSYAAAIDKSTAVANSTGLDKLWATLSGFKALICTWITILAGLVTSIPAETLQAWSGLPWSGFLDQHVASGVTIVFGLLAGIFHAQGISSAAKTSPAPES